MDNIEARGTYKPQERITSKERAEKEQRWKQVSTELNQVTDALGKPIDAGIFDTVVALNLFDIHTSQSCEGHSDHGVLAPWVEIQAPETEHLKALKKRANQTMDMIENFEMQEKPDEELDELYQEFHKLGAEARRPQLEEILKVTQLLAEYYQNKQLTYDRVLTIHGNRLESQGAQLQELMAPEQRIEKLREYQEEMQMFTEFLKKKYLSGA